MLHVCMCVVAGLCLDMTRMQCMMFDTFRCISRVLERAMETYEEYQRLLISSKQVRVSRNRCMGLSNKDQDTV
jgi:hypothetical protein